MLEIFSKKEKQYQEWLSKNSNGFVLTTTSSINPNYMSLHNSSCHQIRNYHTNHASDAFTGQKYIKICSNDIEALNIWILSKGAEEFQKCGICKPQIPVFSKGESFSQREKSSSSDDAKRRARLKKAQTIPEITITQTLSYKRNPDVIVEVLLRANGFCERCTKQAPFKRAKDGTPYLEVHHKEQLSNGGEDNVENAIALCPNCHREAHFG